jgi:hypothetical protein
LAAAPLCDQSQVLRLIGSGAILVLLGVAA